MKKNGSTISDAYYLESKGLLRRAMAVWQMISSYPDTSLCDRELARNELAKLNELIAQKKKESVIQKKQSSNRKLNVESDRQRVLSYFKQGYTAGQIEGLTQRSSAFIYKCKKYL
ncbi:hypothetical protein JW319_10935 [Enterobacter cloacae subsp. cloacae]|uniref:hypothetical protein n=1 Tax=Enterobacter cloacae TaxID=550 RepID=UPI001C5A6151|nr:hypothetical protein [Enterobacter cloacae]MBW4201886.1 hypothetical protein [Enterobacter cloacae subsp. cloacae]